MKWTEKKNQCFKTLGPSLDAVRPHHSARSLLFSLEQKGHARKLFKKGILLSEDTVKWPFAL